MLKEVEIRPGLSLQSDSRFFPLTQDSVLLADFAAPQLRGCGLDLGIGQGFLAALTLLRAPKVTLEGLELIPEAAALAQRNLRRAGFSVPVTVGDLRALPAFMNGRYDFCLCNPPYFEAARGRISPGALGQARSDAGASVQEVCFAANRLLKTGAAPAKLVLLEARKQGGEGLTLLPPLLLREENGDPSPEYRRIYEV